MKTGLAGDNLPEVIVSSSYSKVHGINNAMWLYLNGFLPHVYDGGGGGVGWEQLPYVDCNTGGGGGNTSWFSNPVNEFKDAIGLMFSTKGFTLDGAKAIMDVTKTIATNPGLLKVMKGACTYVGLGIDVVGILDKGINNGWDTLDTSDKLTISAIALTIGGLIFSAGPISSVIIGGYVIGVSVYGAIN